MTTDWKTTLARIASAIGKGLLWLGRHLLALLVAVGRFIVLRAIPAIRAWLRGTAFPALNRFYLWLPHRRMVVAGAMGVAAIAIAVLLLRTPDDVSSTTPDRSAAAGNPESPAGPVVLTFAPAEAPPGAPVILSGLPDEDAAALEITIGGQPTSALRLGDGRLQTRVPLYLGPAGWPVPPAKAQIVEIRRHGRLVAASQEGLRITALQRAAGTTASVQRSLDAAVDAYQAIFEALPARDEQDMAHRRAMLAVLRELVSEGDHSLAAVLAGSSPLLNNTKPDVALLDALMASSGTAANMEAFAAALGAGPAAAGGITMPAAGAGFPALLALPGGWKPGPRCRSGGKDMELACLMQIQGLLDDLATQYIRPTADAWANFTVIFGGPMVASNPATVVISALLSVTNLVIGKVAPSLLPATLTRFELEVPKPLIQRHQTTQSRIMVEARNQPQTITVNDIIDVVKATVGPAIKIDSASLTQLMGFFSRMVDVYMAVLRGVDSVKPNASNAVNAGVLALPPKHWGPIEVTSSDLVSLFSHDESILSSQEEKLEWLGKSQGQAKVRVMPRGPGTRSKVLQDHSLCWGCVWSGGAFGTDMPESSKRISVDIDFDASPRHGVAPLDVELQWRLLPREDGKPVACTLDFGDGSDVERIADCTDTTSFRHTYAHTSRLEDATGGAYVAKLRLDENKAEGKAEVFPDWTFEARPGSGKAPLDARFSWNVPWPEDRKAPRCEFDPGDGSERQSFDDCLATRKAEHRFERRGSFVPSLTIIDGGATDTKTAPVSVADDFACDAEELLKHKAWTGGMSYTKNNEVWDDNLDRNVKFNLRINLKAELAEHTRRQWRGADYLVRYYSPLPQGSADVSFSVHQYDDRGLASYQTFVGNGQIRRQEPDMTEDGSMLNLVLDANQCTFSFFLQGQVYGTEERWSRGEGKKSTQSHYWIESARVEQPLTSSTSISGSVPVQVIPKFDDIPTEQTTWISAHPYIVEALGKGNLGKVTVDWHAEPVD